jgi:excisionase family DNA binding protein
MAYSPAPTRIKWDKTPGLFQGVTIEREIDGTWYAWRVPANGLVSQAIMAELLGVSLMAVNNWVRDKRVKHVKLGAKKTGIPLSEVKRVRAILAKEKRLRGE